MVKIKEVKHIPLSDLEIGRGQVRLRDVGKDIDQLADSIRKVGLLEPIVVCEAETAGKYEIITGQRRFLAHQELQEETIYSAVLDERVDETMAKVLSVTENLVRRGLNSRDLIDVCTFLFKRYGSISAVVDETGLPQSEVSRYVKYDQLIPELKKLVDNGEVHMQTALRAQKAAGVAGEINAEEAVEFAKEMAPMSGVQQSKIVKTRENDPTISSDDAIEDAKTGGKITQIQVTLSSASHKSLGEYASSLDTSLDDAASTLIIDGLSEKGFSDVD